MADDYEDDVEGAQPSAAPAPLLQKFGEAFTNPAARDWAGEMVTRINDYTTRRDIADANTRAGETYVNEIDQFKSGLVSGVTQDPHFVHTALDLVPPTIDAIVSTTPGVEDGDTHRTALSTHIQQEIATAAVTAMAEVHEDPARAMLGDDRISALLGDNATALDRYISMQARARALDYQTQAAQIARDKAEVADRNTANYVAALQGPEGKLQFPARWNQAIIKDSTIAPADRVALFDMHDRLADTGDVATNPHAAIDTIAQLADGRIHPRDLYAQVGENLSIADAAMLGKAARDNPAFLRGLNDTLQDAAREIAPGNTVAETKALGRYVSWLLPNLRQGASIDPKADNWVHAGEETPLAKWAVNGDDMISQVSETRPSLSEIFSRARK